MVTVHVGLTSPDVDVLGAPLQDGEVWAGWRGGYAGQGEVEVEAGHSPRVERLEAGDQLSPVRSAGGLSRRELLVVFMNLPVLTCKCQQLFIRR